MDKNLENSIKIVIRKVYDAGKTYKDLGLDTTDLEEIVVRETYIHIELLVKQYASKKVDEIIGGDKKIDPQYDKNVNLIRQIENELRAEQRLKKKELE